MNVTVISSAGRQERVGVRETLGSPFAGGCSPPMLRRVGIADIGQLADVRFRWSRTIGYMEIRLVLEGLEPPSGRLQVVAPTGQPIGARIGEEIVFTGWLGLLRALYQLTGASGAPPSTEP